VVLAVGGWWDIQRGVAVGCRNFTAGAGLAELSVDFLAAGFGFDAIVLRRGGRE